MGVRASESETVPEGMSKTGIRSGHGVCLGQKLQPGVTDGGGGGLAKAEQEAWGKGWLHPKDRDLPRAK